MSRIVSELLANGCDADSVERLLSQWGGLPLSVPRSPGADHPIARVGGLHLARVLASMFGGERINMPLGTTFRRALLRAQVHQLKTSGLNHTEIARRLGLHLRFVQRVVAEGAPPALGAQRDERQLPLPLPLPEGWQQ